MFIIPWCLWARQIMCFVNYCATSFYLLTVLAFFAYCGTSKWNMQFALFGALLIFSHWNILHSHSWKSARVRYYKMSRFILLKKAQRANHSTSSTHLWSFTSHKQCMIINTRLHWAALWECLKPTPLPPEQSTWDKARNKNMYTWKPSSMQQEYDLTCATPYCVSYA